MNEITYVYGTIALMVGTFAFQVLSRKFDPFAPIWLFFVGYTQVYVVQAISYHDWAVRVRGVELVTEANFRAFWALALFLGAFFFGPGRMISKALPKPPTRWSTTPVVLWSPVLVVWGLFCAMLVVRQSQSEEAASPEAALILAFPMVMLVAGSLLIVTGRQPSKPQPLLTAAGVMVVFLYLLIWMFNGKRSHSLVSVLVGVSSYYIPRLKRPSFPVLVATAMAGMLAVGLSISWRYYASSTNSYGSISKFADFVTTFDPASILESVNLTEKEEKPGQFLTYETEEYGGFLLMMDTVPMKSDYDYGENYLRVFSTFIPRIVWQSKPVYGREQWVAAWIAGSEMKRKEDFTGPAIGILGATQLNGGATATAIVMTILGVLLGTSYQYFRRYADVVWVQACWPLWYYNAWFMTVNDDPANWFYYNFGFTTLPNLVILWFLNKQGGGGRS
jgi:hypothetical protein